MDTGASNWPPATSSRGATLRQTTNRRHAHLRAKVGAAAHLAGRVVRPDLAVEGSRGTSPALGKKTPRRLAPSRGELLHASSKLEKGNGQNMQGGQACEQEGPNMAARRRICRGAHRRWRNRKGRRDLSQWRRGGVAGENETLGSPRRLRWPQIGGSRSPWPEGSTSRGRTRS